MIKGKNAIVTGSTSGIGLGIARALAGAGANVMLNGFGDAGEIERLRAALAAELKVKVGYHGADLSKPEQIRDMVAAATSSAPSTFSSTMPASSTQHRSRISMTGAGTR